MSLHQDESLIESWAKNPDAEHSLWRSGSSSNDHPVMMSRNLSPNAMRNPTHAGDRSMKSSSVERSKNSSSIEPGGNARTPPPKNEGNSKSYQGSKVKSPQNRRCASLALAVAGGLKRDCPAARPVVAAGKNTNSSWAATGSARARAWVTRLFEPQSLSNETASHYVHHRRHLQGDQRHHLSHQLA